MQTTIISPMLTLINCLFPYTPPVKENVQEQTVAVVEETVVEKASEEASQPTVVGMDAKVVEVHEDISDSDTAPSGSLLDRIRAGAVEFPEHPKNTGKQNSPPEFFTERTRSAKKRNNNTRRKG